MRLENSMPDSRTVTVAQEHGVFAELFIVFVLVIARNDQWEGLGHAEVVELVLIQLFAEARCGGHEHRLAETSPTEVAGRLGGHNSVREVKGSRYRLDVIELLMLTCLPLIGQLEVYRQP